MKNVPYLLAKNEDTYNGPSCRLPRHLIDAYDGARIILDITEDAQLAALGLDTPSFRNRLERLVLCAAICHDLGKANDQFQRLVRQRAMQAIRHEWLTVWMLQQPGWKEWITPALGDPKDFELLLWCIATHHLKGADDCDREGRAEPRIYLLQGHPDFRACLEAVRERLGLAVPPQCADVQIRNDEVTKKFMLLRARFLNPDPRRMRLLGAAKATLIAADVGASALPPRGVHLDWIRRRLSVAPTADDYAKLIAERLGEKTLHDFQLEGGQSRSRVTLVRAGCGCGKTLLAYHWAETRSPVRRLYMCYPTTGTATEGFRGYLFDQTTGQSKAGARLFHSRAEVDIERIVGVSREEDAEDTALASLDAWSTPIVSATVDTVLGLIQSHRGAMIAWPALAQAAFCFDEIHSYDQPTFSKLLRFLKELPGVPVLLMTASLPDRKLRAIEEVLKSQNDALHIIPGPKKLEQIPRYHRCHAPSADEVVRDHIASGGKVLWVCNTVGRAMKAYERLADLNPRLYHSRYRYEDRVDRHSDVIGAFESPDPVLAITTQVAEMSLDLSATLLVTDLCPIAALIQRLGRLNRRAIVGNTITMPFIIIEPDAVWPYTKQDYGEWLAASRAWLEKLGDGPLSQELLAKTWNSSLDPELQLDMTSTWLDGRWSERGPLRADSPGISVLLRDDAKAAETDRRRFVESIIPMNQPRDQSWKTWPMVRGVPVAPPEAIRYDPIQGASWITANDDSPPSTDQISHYLV